ncbi:MAG: NAD-dependent epimerase/dehydratase family protein, partial [Solirubrobacteraceae bacterium]
MRVVVTGGAGFIGGNLCARLVREEIGPIVALDDLSTGSRENLDGLEGVELVEASILDTAELLGVAEGAASIVHLAALPSVPRSLADPLA